jgi:predicted lipoprotein with Yx(FWY)xxD motif
MRYAPLVAAILLAGAAASAGPAAEGSTATVSAAANATLKTTILVDQNGLTLYMLTDDTNGKPHCAHIDPTCPRIWPALKSSGKPRAGAGVNAALLGIVTGAGGVRQVTYNHHPLYHFVGDHVLGDVNGQACVGIWFVLTPSGKPFKKGGRPC